MNIISKNKDGYGYKYTDLAEINKYCEAQGITYYQEIETNESNLNDYIITTIVKVQRTTVQHVNVLTLFISKIPKTKETSGQIRRTKFKISFQQPNLSKTASFLISAAKVQTVCELYVRIRYKHY